MPTAFTFAAMPKLIAGPGAAGTLGEVARPLGSTAVLLTGAGALARSGHLARLGRLLRDAGLRTHHYRVAGEPSPAMIDAVVADCRGQEPDLVLAVGGGSVLDAGKAVAAMLKEPGSVVDVLEGVGTRSPSGRTLPVIAVPTTSGTGSEATKNAVISQVGRNGFKKSLRHDHFIPRLALLDPELCVSAPPDITAACGMDALTQLLESYVSTQASPLTDALAAEGLRQLVPALPHACGAGADDLDCRGAVALGAFLSGVTLANAGLGVVHGVAGPMGGIISIPHGIACANLLPGAVSATIDNLDAAGTAHTRAVIAKYALVGRLFGADYQDPMDGCRHLVESLWRWLGELDVPRLGQFGLTIDRVERVVGLAANKNNPLPLSGAQIRRIIAERC